MEAGGVCRCKQTKGSLKGESSESRGQEGPPNSDMDVPHIRERQMLSGSTTTRPNLEFSKYFLN